MWKIGSIFIAAGIALSGAAPDLTKFYLTQQNESACWNPGVTTGMGGLATEVASPSFKTTLPANMSQSDQDATVKSFAVTLQNYAYTGSNDGTINCDAQAQFTYTRPDKSVYTDQGGNVISYELHHSQDGYTEEMLSSDVPNGVFSYTDDGAYSNGSN